MIKGTSKARNSMHGHAIVLRRCRQAFVFSGENHRAMAKVDQRSRDCLRSCGRPSTHWGVFVIDEQKTH
jgi:hypothetical protein